MIKSNVLFRGLSLIEVSIVLSVSAFTMMSLSYFFVQNSELGLSKTVVSQYNILKGATIKYISEQVENESDVTNKAFEVTVNELKRAGYLPSTFNQLDDLSQKMSVWILPKKNYVEGYIVLSGGKNIDLIALKRTALLIGSQGGVVNDKGEVSINGGWFVSDINKLASNGIVVEENKNIIIIKKNRRVINNNDVKFSFKDEGMSRGKIHFSNSYYLNGGNQSRSNTWSPFYAKDAIRLTWNGENISHYKMSIIIDSKELLSNFHFQAKSKEYILYPNSDWMNKTIQLTFKAYNEKGSMVASLQRSYRLVPMTISLLASANIASFPVNKAGVINSTMCIERDAPIVSVLNSLKINIDNSVALDELLVPIMFNLIRKDSSKGKDILYSGVMNSDIYVNDTLHPKFGPSYSNGWSNTMFPRSSVHKSCSNDSRFVIEWRYLYNISSAPFTGNVKLVNN